MQRVNKLEAESLRLCGYKVVRTKHKYFLTKGEVNIQMGYVDYL